MTVRHFRPEISDDRLDLEPIEGFKISRRWALALPACALIAPKAWAETNADQADNLAWGDFLRKVSELNPQDPPRERYAMESYIYNLAALASRMTGAPTPRLFSFIKDQIMIAPAHVGGGIAVISWEMAPNVHYPAHNHPNYSVCTVISAGEVTVRQYEAASTAPSFDSPDSFDVQLTRRQRLAFRSVATLTPVRENIHSFQTGKERVSGYDIGTLHDKDAGFSFVRLAAPDAELQQGVWAATPEQALGIAS